MVIKKTFNKINMQANYLHAEHNYKVILQLILLIQNIFNHYCHLITG